ncbi:hypothetical protein EDD16DRAFT_1767250 [Pisolithus croceorrhizus]|nr:hypothetical protein EDD16DRAFT_1767250 [Pisolithus croceorrhizus]
MFSGSVQPSIVCLFSSTGSQPLSLFSVQVDAALPSDSFVHPLNDSASLPAPPGASLISLPKAYRDEDAEACVGKQLRQTVLHIQSPTLRTTFIQCPASFSFRTDDKGLGLKHAWLQIQVRNLGREWSFEVGIADKTGKHGVIRCSTFQVTSGACPYLPCFMFWRECADNLFSYLQKNPTLRCNYSLAPVLHLPLKFPSSSSNALTAWSTVTVYLPGFIPQFASVSRDQRSRTDASDEDGSTDPSNVPSPQFLPGGAYAHLTHIKIYATCRLRRIWLSDSPPGTGGPTPWEFELYGD